VPSCYLNGAFLPLEQANVSVLDRGFIFGDGVYEVIPVFNGRLFRLEQHLWRLEDSLAAVRIKPPLPTPAWEPIFERLVRENGGGDQSLYVQITRGAAKRDHVVSSELRPTVFAMVNPLDPARVTEPVSAITCEDIRWKYCNIKAIALLPNVLLRLRAADAGAYEAIMIRDGRVTEGAASNVFIVSDDVIKTPLKSTSLLAGITRDLLIELLHMHKLPLQETRMMQAELLTAQEIWLTSSVREIVPVTVLDGKPVHDGRVGPRCRQVMDLYQAFKRAAVD
jgi:D-alanine transaminase